MSEQNRKQLHFLSRATRHNEPSMSVRVGLLPREVFADDPETLDLYDKYVNLRTAYQENERATGRERTAATTEQSIYLRKIREALAVGGDTSKIKNDAEKHTAASQAHAQLSSSAMAELTRVARSLAHRIAEVAPNLLTPSEQRLETEADKMRKALTNLRNAWAGYATAWQERRILGDAALFGGQLANYDPRPTFPPNVSAAIATLENHLGDLDRLKSDEELIRVERPEGVQV
jgi:hypothetical protein